MRARTFYLLNIFAAIVLLVALYLNFVHKEMDPMHTTSFHKVMAVGK